MLRKVLSADVVIGAGYGDEGKGVLTDALAAPHGGRATVMRFNGGAQAGHTVTLADGRRHVFHHVGSGALAGAATYLSRFFVANPILLAQEISALTSLGVAPRIAIDPAAPVTTPYDMMINQIVERARAGGRHGSCGLGFGETLERNLRPEFALTVRETADRNRLRRFLRHIRDIWAPERLRRLGVGHIAPADQAHLASDAILERWLDDVEAFRECVTMAPMTRLASMGKLIFEGAQGLMLDQDSGAFPYVTRSHTGLRNVMALASSIGLDRLDVTYVTRAYVTRHGAGPLAHELDGLPHPDAVDATNVANAWQGTLRYGTLDLDILARTILRDRAIARNMPTSLTYHLAVTCLDQVGKTVSYVSKEAHCEASPDELAAAAARTVGATSLIGGWGPKRTDLAGMLASRASAA
jgi:adenylosuccinate synthase